MQQKSLQDSIAEFLSGSPHAVVGASRDRSKWGNSVLRAFLKQGRKVYAINPTATEIEGVPCFASLADLPEPVHGISVVTPPEISTEIVKSALAAGIRHIWLQPGADSYEAKQAARAAGVDVIAGGACILVEFAAL